MTHLHRFVHNINFLCKSKTATFIHALLMSNIRDDYFIMNTEKGLKKLNFGHKKVIKSFVYSIRQSLSVWYRFQMLLRKNKWSLMWYLDCSTIFIETAVEFFSFWYFVVVKSSRNTGNNRDCDKELTPKEDMHPYYFRSSFQCFWELSFKPLQKPAGNWKVIWEKENIILLLKNWERKFFIEKFCILWGSPLFNEHLWMSASIVL